ncbi:hypothetical protein LR48_Vigan569s000500 [Vigna angularis]|uniref:Uncharacterized protein n=1 Tax=Phaseolus angularis TaxID=3914 RepID=A0A0L9TEY5_PHAAN|nr:hypothetical protein LR48_Vigan569s000500 [Vigna angularis]
MSPLHLLYVTTIYHIDKIRIGKNWRAQDAEDARPASRECSPNERTLAQREVDARPERLSERSPSERARPAKTDARPNKDWKELASTRRRERFPSEQRTLAQREVDARPERLSERSPSENERSPSEQWTLAQRARASSENGRSPNELAQVAQRAVPIRPAKNHLRLISLRSRTRGRELSFGGGNSPRAQGPRCGGGTTLQELMEAA